MSFSAVSKGSNQSRARHVNDSLFTLYSAAARCCQAARSKALVFAACVPAAGPAVVRENRRIGSKDSCRENDVWAT